MWGASARAHVHTSFERWCLLARSSIADQGVILVTLAFRRIVYVCVCLKWCVLNDTNDTNRYTTFYRTRNRKYFAACLRAECEARSESTSTIREKSQYERPACRPAVVTLFERLFLWNGMTNSRTVILIRCHHPINHVFDRYRYPPVPATARGTCRGEGVEDTLSLGNSTTAGPIAFKFGV